MSEIREKITQAEAQSRASITGMVAPWLWIAPVIAAVILVAALKG